MKRFVLLITLLVITASASQSPEDENKGLVQYSPEPETLSTFVTTYGGLVVFSYEDDNYIEVFDSTSTRIHFETLDTDEYFFLDDLEVGVYEITSYGLLSVMTGDPFSEGLGCWYAVDEYSRPLSTKLLTVGQKLAPMPDRDAIFIIFGYTDNTHVNVRNVDTDIIIWEGDLDAGELYLNDDPVGTPQVLAIESSYPVSVRTAGGVNGNYIPAFNGTFTGLEFYAYQHRWAGHGQNTMIIPWEDNTTVEMWDIMADPESDPSIQTQTCAFRGDVTLFPIPEQTAVYVRSNKPISLSQTQWSYPGQVFFYLARGIDETGLGLGSEFFIPLQYTISDIHSRLTVTAFSDFTDVTISRINRNDFSDEGIIYTGTLDKGEYYRYTCQQVDEHVAIYHVQASKPVTALASTRDGNGSDFLPVWYTARPAIAIIPSPQMRSTPAGVPEFYDLNIENNGNTADVINLNHYNTETANFMITISDIIGNSLSDNDGDGQPDTDTLWPGSRFDILVEVFPSMSSEVGDTDTCFVIASSSQNPSSTDTAVLITTIVEGSVSEELPEALVDVSFDPVAKAVHLVNPFSQGLTISIYDVGGRKLLTEYTSLEAETVNLTDFSSGVYFLSVLKGKSEILNRKIILR